MEKKRNSGERLALWLFFVLLLLLIILGGITLIQKRNDGVATAEYSVDESVAETSAEKTEPEEVTENDDSQPETPAVNADFKGLELNSETALLTDLNGTELFSKKPDEKVYPASLTKIMTAILTIENVYDLDETILITGDIITEITAENSSTAGFMPYEEVTYRDLLYGTLLSSGGECSLTLANYVSGSEWEFVQKMNDKAAELGMENTHFTNVCGFHDYEHYSTANDIAKLLKYALDNDTFYEIFTSKTYYTETSEHPNGITLTSTMFTEMDSPEFDGGRILGGKTGFTDEAGLCLASIAEVDGKIYILVTMGAPGTHSTEPLHIYDAMSVYGRIGA